MSERRVAVVTGSNKGIGYAIVRGLCKQFDGDVILTARNETLGNEAAGSLKKEGLNPKFHQLDICDKSSIEKLRAFLKANYGGLDILINNAGIAYKQSSTTPFAEQAEVTCKTNFNGTLDVCNILFPILRAHARVCNISGGVVRSTFPKCSPEVQARLTDENLTMPQLEGYFKEFVDSAKAGDFAQKGYPQSAYSMSKVGVTVMTLVQHRDMLRDPREDIVINCCCPGYVDTDMTSHKGRKTIDEGADTPIYLALLPPGVDSPKGEYISDRCIQDWTKSSKIHGVSYA